MNTPMPRWSRRALVRCGLVLTLWSCGGAPAQTDGRDGGVVDGGTIDGSVLDGGTIDGGVVDGGVVDGGVVDGGAVDGGAIDGGVVDGGVVDGGVVDGGALDGGVSDGGFSADAGVVNDGGFGPDGGNSPDGGIVSCGNEGTLPAFVERLGERFLARCGATTLALSVLEAGTLRLRYQGESVPDRSFVVRAAAPMAARFGAMAGGLHVCTPLWTAVVEPTACRVLLRTPDGLVLEDAAGYFEAQDGSRGLARRSPEGERFFGFGDKSGPLDKRGRALVFWNTDAYDDTLGGVPPDTDPRYQSIPFHVGLRGGVAYGVFTDNAFRQTHEVGRDGLNHVRVHGGVFEQYLFAGPRVSDVLRRYTALTGRTPLPPRWALGYHQSRWGYYPASTIQELCEEFRIRRIPLDGVWFDIQHMDGLRSFTWEPAGFPDPAALLRALLASGCKSTVILDPGLRAEPGWDVYDQGLLGDHFLRRPDGGVYQGTVWPGLSVFPDFSAPQTRTWWSGLVAAQAARGVRGLWIDMNEPTVFEPAGMPLELPIAGDGVPSTMAEGHNVYALGEARATYEGMRAAAPTLRPFVLTRAGYAGIARYAAVWTGDAPSRWDTLRETVTQLLGLGLSGVPFVGSDVGGYGGNASPELFARWMQVGALSPFFRGHTRNTGALQEPWRFGQEVEDISRAAIEERYRLLPYFYSLFAESAESGAPVLRPLLYEFQDDAEAVARGDQVMVGPWLLAAPVLEEGATMRTVYLPAGRWYEALSGAVFEGPRLLDTAVTLAALPTFVREGAIVPRGVLAQASEGVVAADLFLDLYPAAAPSTFTHYEDDGESFAHEAGVSSKVRYTLQRTANGATLSADARVGSFSPPARTLRLRVRRVDGPVLGVTLDGAALLQASSAQALAQVGSGFFHDPRDLSLQVAFADRAGFRLEMRYDPALTADAATVLVPVEVTVPEGTPREPGVYVASSATGWAHVLLPWSSRPNVAAGLLPVTRGEWFFYKYSRGGWPTVEKWSGCAEATNRYGFGAASPLRQDRVALWADACP